MYYSEINNKLNQINYSLKYCELHQNQVWI